MNFPSFEEVFKILSEWLGDPVVIWASRILGILGVIYLILKLIGESADIVITKIIPIFYSKENKERNKNRQRFASMVKSHIEERNKSERWQDEQYINLEVEVGAEGKFIQKGFFRTLRQNKNESRWEHSLTTALLNSKEKIILLVGEPGSGKSIALRHLAIMLAKKAAKSESNKTEIPLYINLKYLERKEDEVIDRELIESFIFSQFNKDPLVKRFFEQEYSKGLQEGSWIFLFDSFDEIPDILSASESSPVIFKYAEAINAFIGGFTLCRGIVASRPYHMPKHISWPNFYIRGFTSEQQHKLAHSMGINGIEERNFFGQLSVSPAEIRNSVKNPLLFSLLITHLRSGHPTPSNFFQVLDINIKDRLKSKQAEISGRFGLAIEQVQNTAELVAYTMSASENLGLRVTVRNLERAIIVQGLEVPENMENHLKALDLIRVARYGSSNIESGEIVFEFSLRRFQEYFTTCFALRNPQCMDFQQMLTNSRWRETTVVYCQTMPKSNLEMLFNQARLQLDRNITTINSTLEEALETKTEKQPKLPNYPWPEGLIHLLGLLQDGFSRRIKILPPDIREKASCIIEKAWQFGGTYDKKWALEVSGIITDENLQRVILEAISSKSKVLNNAAFNQMARLENIPKEVSLWLRHQLMTKLSRFSIYRERDMLIAYFSRLRGGNQFVNDLNILLVSPIIDFLAVSFIGGCLGWSMFNWNALFIEKGSGGLFGAIFLILFFMLPALFMVYLTYLLVAGSPSIDKFRLYTSYILMLFVRILLGVTAITSLINDHQYLFTLPLILVTYILILTPTSLMLYSEGKLLSNSYDWIFSPFTVAAKVSQTAIKTYKASKNTEDPISLKVLFLILIISGGIIFLINRLFNYFKDLQNQNPRLLLIPLSCFLTVFLVVSIFSYFATKESRKQENADTKRWSQWINSPPQRISASELIKTLESFSNFYYWKKTLSYVRQKRILEYGSESETILRNIIIQLETRKPDEHLWGQDTLDELCLLLEQIRSQKM